MLFGQGYSEIINLMENSWFNEKILYHPFFRNVYNIFDPQRFILDLLTFSNQTLLYLNSIVFIDLYLTLRNPFFPRQKRYPMYIIMFCFCNIYKLTTYFIYTNYSGFVKNKIIEYIIILWVSAINYLIDAAVMIFIFKFLLTKGTERNLKTKLFFRYFAYGIFFIFHIILTYFQYKDTIFI